jgi:hypothetical protein
MDPHYYELLGTHSVANDVKNCMENKGDYPFNKIPIAVVTADNRNDLGFSSNQERDWLAFQKQLVKSSRNSYQIIAYKSGHFIQLNQPSLVIDSIYTMTKVNK